MLLFALFCLAAAALAGFAYYRARASSTKSLAGAGQLRALEQANQKAKAERAPLSTVQPGAVIQFQNVGLGSATIDAQVTARHVHKAGADRWVELEADTATGKSYFTVLPDGEANATLKSVSCEQLGLDCEDWEPGGKELESLSFEATDFQLASEGRAQFCPNGNELEGESYYYWEYESSEDEFQTLTVVRWQDGSVEAFYGARVPAEDVTVFSVG